MDVQTFYFTTSENIPNNPDLPVVIDRQAIKAVRGSMADAFAERFQKHNWRGIWRWSIYDFHHYHSNAHEILGVAAGEAKVVVGGPDGKTLSIRSGDTILLPAGTGHKNLRCSPDFQVVGAYPPGQEEKDLMRNDQQLDTVIRQRIKDVALPTTDPVFGTDGPLRQEWCSPM